MSRASPPVVPGPAGTARSSHLALAQAPGSGPQFSAIGITSHSASTQRRPRDGRPAPRSPPPHVLGSRSPAVSNTSARPNGVPPAPRPPPRPASPRPASPGQRAPQLPAPRRCRRPRSPPGWGATPARSALTDPEAAQQPPAPGLRRPDGPCLAARGSAPWTLLGHVTRPPGCQPEDTPRRGQSAGGAAAEGGGTQVTRKPGAGRRGRGGARATASASYLRVPGSDFRRSGRCRSQLTASWVCGAGWDPYPTTLGVLRPPNLEFLLGHSITRVYLLSLQSSVLKSLNAFELQPQFTLHHRCL